MPDAYVYRADVWCEDCIRNVLLECPEGLLKYPHAGDPDAEYVSTNDLLAAVVSANGRDPQNESTWDSDEYPKGPYSDGGGEADTPQHCAGCCTFLENPLTHAGLDYVLAQLREGPRAACILTAENMHTADDCTMHDHEKTAATAEWLAYYGDDAMADGRTLREAFEQGKGGMYIVPHDANGHECEERDARTWAVFEDIDHVMVAKGFASFGAAESWINQPKGAVTCDKAG